MGAERRQHVRIEVPMPVLLTHHALGTNELVTVDICDNGIFLKAEPDQCPTVGDEVTLQLKSGILGDGEEPPLVKARVVRVTEDGIGIQFL
jgi:hypothetical protein